VDSWLDSLWAQPAWVQRTKPSQNVGCRSQMNTAFQTQMNFLGEWFLNRRNFGSERVGCRCAGPIPHPAHNRMFPLLRDFPAVDVPTSSPLTNGRPGSRRAGLPGLRLIAKATDSPAAARVFLTHLFRPEYLAGCGPVVGRNKVHIHRQSNREPRKSGCGMAADPKQFAF